MRPQLDLYVFVDALGWNLVERYHFGADFLPVRHAVRTQLGYSAGAVPTILSGRSPEEHHHFSFFRYAPGQSPFHRLKWLPSWLLPDALFGRHRVRHHLSKWLKKCLGYTGYFQIYRVPFRRLPYLDYTEKRDMFIPGGLETVKNLADVWQEQHRRWHISDWRRSGEYNFAEFERLIGQEAVECGFLYCAELDGFLHLHVGEPDAVAAEFHRYEERLRKLLAVAEQHYERVNFTVFSDHGMTPLRGTLDVRPVFEGYRWGRDYASVTDSTMVRLWWLNDAARPVIRERIEHLGHGHFLSDGEKKAFRIAFSDSYYGDDIYLLDAGWQCAPSDMGGKALPGMHGFSPEDGDSDAAYLSNAEPRIMPGWIGDFFRIMTLPAGKAQADSAVVP